MVKTGAFFNFHCRLFFACYNLHNPAVTRRCSFNIGVFPMREYLVRPGDDVQAVFDRA